MKKRNTFLLTLLLGAILVVQGCGVALSPEQQLRLDQQNHEQRLDILKEQTKQKEIEANKEIEKLKLLGTGRYLQTESQEAELQVQQSQADDVNYMRKSAQTRDVIDASVFGLKIIGAFLD